MKNLALIAFNKPYGVVCQFTPHEHHPSLKDYIKVPGVYPAGRLDTDSEGLLLLTGDGALQTKISHPSNKMVKTYWAQVEGTPDEEKINQLRKGVALKEFTTQPAEVRLLLPHERAQLWPRNPPIRVRKTVPDFWLELKIKEGKNRQVRRMCAKVGWPCLRLVRVAIGSLNIFETNLAQGQWQLTEKTKLAR